MLGTLQHPHRNTRLYDGGTECYTVRSDGILVILGAQVGPVSAEGSPVHPELGGDPVEAQRHQGHVWDAFGGAGRRAFLHGGLQEAEVDLDRDTLRAVMVDALTGSPSSRVKGLTLGMETLA